VNAQRSAAPNAAVRYGVAVFLSSGLLFLIEPIAGKRVLPLLGGSSAVWTACLVFFQAALLLGYFAAHLLSTRARPRTQALTYVGLLALSLLQLSFSAAIALHADPLRPIGSVLLLLTELIGLPFVTLSISGPLLQAWFARLRAADGAITAQPYRLYAISNIGSLLALLAYPWLIEPRASLRAQMVMVAVGGVVLLAAAGTIALPLLRESLVGTSAGGDTGENGPTRHESAGDRVLWILLATCGSLLLSAVTTYISQNVATIPLLWIIPLVAYLLSFVVAFSDERWHPRWLVLPLAAAGAAGIGYRMYRGDLDLGVSAVVAIYCAALFAICLFCHSELYHRRPAAARLTTFYFCLAIGGAIGAILVGVVAPLTLPGNYELVLGLCFAALLALAATWRTGWVLRAACFGALLVLAALARKQVRDDSENAIMRQRNFYGTLYVTQETVREYHARVRTLYHGIIEHGQEIFRADLDTMPTTYYGHQTGVGLAIDLCCRGRPRRIGVVGLGTGTLAAYGRPGDVIRFYDINPAVEPVARRYFTYLRNSRAAIEVVPGDARVSLAAEPPQRYDVLAIDAFSGDAIPVHLITSEALEVYKRHLAAGGVVAFHISNRYLNLAPIVQQLADHAGMQTSFISSEDDKADDVFSADWVLVTNNADLLGVLKFEKDRETIAVPPGLRRWTDDYNSLLPILKLKRDD
jgi:spermidine synthase